MGIASSNQREPPLLPISHDPNLNPPPDGHRRPDALPDGHRRPDAPPDPPPPMMGHLQNNFHHGPPFNPYAHQVEGMGPLPPNVLHRNAKLVRHPVAVYRDTLKIEVDEQNPHHSFVCFVFDAKCDCSITILYLAKESNGEFVPLANSPVKIPFEKGLLQRFCQPLGTGIDLGLFKLDDLSKPSPGIFPLVILAEWSAASNSFTTADTSVTLAVLEKNNNGLFHAKVVEQRLSYGEGSRRKTFRTYGGSNVTDQMYAVGSSGEECIVCMAEPTDTVIFPCRHKCMCYTCVSKLLRKSEKCALCRQHVQEVWRLH